MFLCKRSNVKGSKTFALELLYKHTCRIVLRFSKSWPSGLGIERRRVVRRSRFGSSKARTWRWNALRLRTAAGPRLHTKSKLIRTPITNAWWSSDYGRRTLPVFAWGSLVTICLKSLSRSSWRPNMVCLSTFNLRCLRAWRIISVAHCMN